MPACIKPTKVLYERLREFSEKTLSKDVPAGGNVVDNFSPENRKVFIHEDKYP